jgi:hypothetical protein
MYFLYDYYEGQDLIGTFDNWHDAMAAKREYIKDTDGECDVDIVYIEVPEEG